VVVCVGWEEGVVDGIMEDGLRAVLFEYEWELRGHIAKERQSSTLFEGEIEA
jgi:hypothetical protein